MYIIYESMAGNDPRKTPLIEDIASEWHYTIAHIKPENLSKVNLEWYKATEITEGMAYAYHFTNAVNEEVSLMKSTSNPKDMVQPTSFGEEGYTKVDYKLTSTDELNAVGLLKAIMLNWAENHLSEETGLVQIKTKVPTLKRLKETQMFMATYFETEFAYTAGKEKTPEFQTTKFSQQIIP